MHKGLLAEWRRGLVTRGLAAAALLVVPVGVAAAIGFGNSFSGLTSGLGSLASGPERAGSPARSAAIDDAIASVAVTTVAVPPAGAPRGPAGDGDGGAPTAPSPGAGSGATQLPAAGGGVPGVPGVQAPTGGGGGVVGDLIEGVGESVNGLLGGGR